LGGIRGTFFGGGGSAAESGVGETETPAAGEGATVGGGAAGFAAAADPDATACGDAVAAGDGPGFFAWFA
jgi:hypothetical protein